MGRATRSMEGRARWAVLVLLMGVFGGCARERGTLVVGLDGAPVTLDPYHHNDNRTWLLLSNFYDSLVRFSEDMRVLPALAERWELLDERRLRFHLRAGVTFSNGQSLGAADVVASFNRASRDPNSRIRYHLLGIRAVRAEDERTVVVETEQPSPTLLNRLAFLFIVPERDAAQREIRAPNGTGPYRMVGYTPGDSLIAEGWASWRGMPAIRRVRFVFAQDTADLTRRFFADRIDVARLISDDEVTELRRHPGLRAAAQPRMDVQMLAINPLATSGEARRALADPEVRLALLVAINRSRTVGQIFMGAGAVATQYVHPVVFGFDPGITAVPYDPQRARQLLLARGFAAGFEVPLAYTPVQRDVAAAIAGDLAQIGVRVREEEVSWSRLLGRARADRSPLTLFSWSCTTGDASDFLNVCLHSRSPEAGLGAENFAGFADPGIDSLIEHADREFDPDRRLALLQEAQRRALAAMPILPLTIRFGYMGASDRVDVAPRHDQWLWVQAFRWRHAGG